ncbi:hypothetical protein B0O99DRAFT_686368 [Bisporella sp. PMI_857]|nr:hypothetical protein B0O99DRAFT_686368 [Bisporella sp. PMI_857]
MKCFVQFVTTPTADTPGTTLYLHFDAKRYMIGHLAEGTQRAARETKTQLPKLGDVFLTGKVGWDTAGGVFGMLLTLADAAIGARETKKAILAEKAKRSGKKNGVEEETKSFLNISGGRNLTHMLATARKFVFRKGMPVHTQEFTAKNTKLKEDGEPTWRDDLVNVWAMVLDPAELKSTRKRSHDEFTEEESRLEKERADLSDIHDQQRRGVLADMFDSEWRLDALVSKKLSEVKLPAQIFVRKEGKLTQYDGPTGAHAPDIDVLVRNPWPGALIAELPPTTPSSNATSYIIKTHPQRGRFNPQVAKELGVEKTQFNSLTKGEAITTKAGTIVTPEQVMGASKPGGGFAVFDLPDSSYIEAAISRKEWSSKVIMEGVGVAIWILGPGVAGDPRLLQFMEAHTKLKHIVSSKDICPDNLAMLKAAGATVKLSLIDPERFSIPQYSTELPSTSSTLPYERAIVGTVVQLQPSVEVQKDKITPYLSIEDIAKKASEDTEIKLLAEEANSLIKSEEYLKNLDERQEDLLCKDAEVITLGTGSSLPSSYRNVSATLLRVPGYGSYLFDCGENTLGQLKRVLGKELPAVLRDLKAIWISHLHADHHLGTAAVIKAWKEETQASESTKDNQIIVSSDKDMLSWLNEYSQVEEYGYERIKQVIMGSQGDKRHKFSKEDTATYGLASIEACLVKHCKGALAVAFNFPNGFKVAYSGDCRPSQEFVTIGQNATLLIHEATFDDELCQDALAKNHCTTSEALDIGQRMNARRILLTHFSQRYQKIPIMPANENDQVAIVAFDYMRTKLGDFKKVEEFRPALAKLYEEETAELEERTVHKVASKASLAG